MKRVLKKLTPIQQFIQIFISIYSKSRVSTAAAGLAYFLSMSLFPFAIVIFAIVGNNYDTAMLFLDNVKTLMTDDAYVLLSYFLEHISSNYSPLMLYAAISAIVLTASAGMRSVHLQIGEMQGERRFIGIALFVASVISALVFAVEMVIGVLVIMTGKKLIRRVFLMLGISIPLVSVQYVLVIAATSIVITVIYRMSQPWAEKYIAWPGGLLTGIGFVALSNVFSFIISKNSKYSLLYGGLASIILVLFWLYCLSQIIYLGAALNVTIRDYRREKLKKALENYDAAQMETEPSDEQK